MTRDEMIALMQGDLKNEYTHMLFYQANAATVGGLHRIALREWLEEEAESEMGHVGQFSRLIRSLGENPVVSHHDFPQMECPQAIVEYAIGLEAEVCRNYARRIDQAMEVPGGELDYAAWRRVSLFYEDQLSDSHSDLDELREWGRSFT